MRSRRRHALNLLGVMGIAVIAMVDYFDRIYLWLPFMFAATGNVVVTSRKVESPLRADVWFEWFTRVVFGFAAAVLLADQVFAWGWRAWFLPGVAVVLTAAVLVYAFWEYREWRAQQGCPGAGAGAA